MQQVRHNLRFEEDDITGRTRKYRVSEDVDFRIELEAGPRGLMLLRLLLLEAIFARQFGEQ